MDVMCGVCGKVTVHQRSADGSMECVSCRARRRVEMEEQARAAGAAAAAAAPFVPPPGQRQAHCRICDGTTWHDERGCMRCRLAGDERVTVDNLKRKMARTRRNIVGAVALAGVLVVGSGFFHCVHGADISVVKLVPKEDWGFYDQFVDLDEIIGTPLITQVGRARTIRALIRAELIQPPSFGRDEEE